MSEELESLGALTTAGLAAAALDRTKDGHEAARAHAAEHGTCANCNAPLTGPFCASCGQSAHIHRSLLHLIEEILHGILHFDAKAWRTIPLLIFFPGRLTRRYIDGQRTRYISPLILFLFMVFLGFFVASLGGKQPIETVPETAAERQAHIAEITKELADAQLAATNAVNALEAARKAGGALDDLQEKLDDARQEQRAAELALKLTNAAAEVAAATTAPATDQPAPGAVEPDDSTHSLGEKLAAKLKGKRALHTSIPALDKAIKHVLDNPDLALYKLKNTTYKYSFMLVPISLPFLWLMFFWKRGVVLFDHAVFVLYSLCFMSLLFVVIVLLGKLDWGGTILLLTLLAPPLHIFAQLRGTYRLGVFSALWRTGALLCVAGIVLILFILFVLAISMG